MKAKEFFLLSESLQHFSHFFLEDSFPWDWIPSIEKALLVFFEVEKLSKPHNKFSGFGQKNSDNEIGENVFLGKNVKLPRFFTIEENVYIGDNTEIRSGALIRKNTIIGQNCVIGNSCEIKNSLIMDHSQIAHFNYVGDSILGNHTHLSAGAILSNFRFDGENISAKTLNGKTTTCLRKFGAILGDNVQIGCNSVVLPGSIISKNSIISAGTTWGGFLEENTMIYPEIKYQQKQL